MKEAPPKTVFSRADQTPKRRELRATRPPAEALLWRHLRGEVLGAKWRRQHSVGLFVLDFYCATLKLAIEIDGPSHHETSEADAVRQNWIEEYGVKFLRFTNQQVYREMEAVVDTIRAGIAERRRELGNVHDGPLCPLDISPLAGGDQIAAPLGLVEVGGGCGDGPLCPSGISPLAGGDQIETPEVRSHRGESESPPVWSPPAKGEMPEGQRGPL